MVSFVNNVYASAKHCNFGALHDEMVRDILVAGIHTKNYWNNYSWMMNLLWKGCDMYSAVRNSSPATSFLHRDNTGQFSNDAVKKSRKPGKIHQTLVEGVVC